MLAWPRRVGRDDRGKLPWRKLLQGIRVEGSSFRAVSFWLALKLDDPINEAGFSKSVIEKREAPMVDGKAIGA